MTEKLNANQIVHLLAELVPARNRAVEHCEQLRSDIEAEFAAAFTEEKRLKEQVEHLKVELRTLLAETGEKAPGVTLAHVQVVSHGEMPEAEVVAWCCQYAPEILTLRGANDIRKWFFSASIQTVNMGGQPAAVFIAERQNDDGTTTQYGVPCPFHLEPETQVRISESALITELDQQKWEAEHEDIQK